MKKNAFLCIIGWSILSIQNADAHSHDHVYIVENPSPVYVVQALPENVIEVQSQPPVDLVENVMVCPGSASDYAWIGGHWIWNGRWEWAKGYWAQKPHVAAVWVPGHWRVGHHDHRWIWEEGRWR